MPLTAISTQRARSRGGHVFGKHELLLAADPLDRGRDLLAHSSGRIFLVEVARLQQMFGEQLFDMGRTVERREHLPEPRGDLGHDDIGKAAAGLLRPLFAAAISAASASSYSRSITARNSASLDLK